MTKVNFELVIALLFVTLVLPGAVQADSVQYWIGDSTGQPTTQVMASLNEEFTLSVWMTTDYPSKAAEVLFGYDTSVSKGASAIKRDNKVGFVMATPSGAYSNKYPVAWYGGDYNISSTDVRPGGYRISMSSLIGNAPFAKVKLLDITLKNLGVGLGQEYYIGLWNSRVASTSGSMFCTKSGTTARYRDCDAADIFNPTFGPGSGWAVKITNPQLMDIDTLGRARSLANPTAVRIMSDLVVTAGTDDFAGAFYVEQPDRSSGMRVIVDPNAPISVLRGRRISLAGRVDLSQGERVIRNPQVTDLGQTSLAPVFMTNKALGGAEMGSDQPGVWMGQGVLNVGSLVKTYGVVTLVSNDFFYIDDGSVVWDNPPFPNGIRVVLDGLAFGKSIVPPVATTVSVTGISSVAQVNGHYVRCIRPRPAGVNGVSDILPLF